MSNAQLKLSCKGCGAALEYSAGAQALKCPFCNSVTDISKPEENTTDGPALIIPLSVELNGLTDAVYEHLASGDLTPDHLLEHAVFEKKDRFYVPAYDFEGEYTVHWTASFGYDRQEHYTAYETRTQNGVSRQVAVNRTKTVTDWRPVNGTDSGVFSVRSYAGRLLIDAGSNVPTLVEEMPEAEHAPYDASYTVGVDVEAVNQSSEDAFTSRATPRINQIIDQSVQQHAQGDHQKDWHWKGKIGKRSTALLVPVCHAIYLFEGKQYNVWVSGNDTSRMVADPLPVDKRRKLAINLGFIPVLLSLVSAALAVFEFDSAWGLPLSVIPVAAAYGILRKKTIISYSRKIRKALLAERNAASSNTAQMNANQQSALSESVKQPSKPWLANSALDKFLLPIVAVLAVVAPFGATIHLPQKLTGGSPSSAISVSVPLHTDGAPSAEVREARVAVPPVPVQAPAAPAWAPPAETPASPVQATVADTTGSDSQVHGAPIPAAPEPPVGVIAQMLQLARANNWSAVDELAVTSQAPPADYPAADLNNARIQNNEGIAALRRNDPQAAVVVFQRAAQANPSDPQILDNLAFALIRTQRSAEAVPLLTELLRRFPGRATAWGNLSAAVIPDIDTATSALKLAFHFNQNRERITNYFAPLAASYPDVRFRAVISAVLSSANSIPVSRSDHAEQPAVQQRPVPVAEVRATEQPYTQPQNATAEAVRQMIADGQTCFESKQYACAITNATNALRIQPGTAEAQQLKAAAEAAQADALHRISIN